MSPCTNAKRCACGDETNKKKLTEVTFKPPLNFFACRAVLFELEQSAWYRTLFFLLLFQFSVLQHSLFLSTHTSINNANVRNMPVQLARSCEYLRILLRLYLAAIVWWLHAIIYMRATSAIFMALLVALGLGVVIVFHILLWILNVTSTRLHL